MSEKKDKYYPKTKAEFDAFRKAMDNATTTLLKNGGKRGSTAKGSSRSAAKK